MSVKDFDKSYMRGLWQNSSYAASRPQRPPTSAQPLRPLADWAAQEFPLVQSTPPGNPAPIQATAAALTATGFGPGMRALRFEVWQNAKNAKDPEHMTMADRSVPSDQDNTYDFQQVMTADRKPKRLEPPHPGAGSVRYQDAQSGEQKTAYNTELNPIRTSVGGNIENQLVRTQGNPPRDRFTHRWSVVVRVNEEEYQHVLQQAQERRKHGVYNFVQEAQAQNPHATRCLSLLEDLSKKRGHTLGPGKASAVLGEFKAVFPESISSEHRVNVV